MTAKRSDVISLLLLRFQYLWTALHIGCKRGSSMIVEILLRHGADFSRPDKSGNLPIHIACLVGHAECISSLLRYGADCSIPNRSGDPAIHLACRGVHADAVRILMKWNTNCIRCMNKVTMHNSF